MSRVVYTSAESCSLPVEFRYVSECLPDVPLPKRAASWSRPAITRPRRLTSNDIMWGIVECIIVWLLQSHPFCWNQREDSSHLTLCLTSETLSLPIAWPCRATGRLVWWAGLEVGRTG